jgi:hypothetical protein
MTPPPASLFQSYLLPAERILWTGRPSQGLALHPSDIFFIPFSLLWTGIVLFMFLEAWNSPFGGGPDLFLLLFLAVGLYAVIGRFFHDAAIRKSTAYALTDQRVLLLQGNGSKFVSLDVHRLPRLELSEHRDGTGTIAFDSANHFFMGFSRYGGWEWWVPSLGAPSRFFRIADPRTVYQLIRDHSVRA